ncbi:hypothetical protein QUF58_02945 [Anaerolineales bacterium HSG24]|nr:hypothetical protein [Anaerolineales bacterium HSG24]
MSRTDLTNYLIHFTKPVSIGNETIDGFHILLKILYNECLIGGTGYIKGDYRCICFSEAPIEAIKESINRKFQNKYSPFGIRVSKEWLFNEGGRPVIYQPDSEFELLPDSLKWRHVRFDLGDNPVDFTWEREWRIRCDELSFSPDGYQLK